MTQQALRSALDQDLPIAILVRKAAERVVTPCLEVCERGPSHQYVRKYVVLFRRCALSKLARALSGTERLVTPMTAVTTQNAGGRNKTLQTRSGRQYCRPGQGHHSASGSHAVLTGRRRTF